MADSAADADAVGVAADENVQAKADILEEEIQRQKDALGQLKATKVKEKRDKNAHRVKERPTDELEKEKENDSTNAVAENGKEPAPAIEPPALNDTVKLAEASPAVEEGAAGEENMNDSLKSLAGSTSSTFDTDDDRSSPEGDKPRDDDQAEPKKRQSRSDGKSQRSDQDTDRPQIRRRLTEDVNTDDGTNSQAYGNSKTDMDDDPSAEADLNELKNDDIISTSDVNPTLGEKDDFFSMMTRPACAPSEISDTEARKLAETQAQYILPSAFNYAKKNQPQENQSDSDSDVEIFKEPCKCENIKKDTKVKTKVCSML